MAISDELGVKVLPFLHIYILLGFHNRVRIAMTSTIDRFILARWANDAPLIMIGFLRRPIKLTCALENRPTGNNTFTIALCRQVRR